MISHPTSHPKIIFAKGDLFSQESLSLFDGILAFAEGYLTGINNEAYQALEEGRITCPHRIYGVENPRAQTPLSRIRSIVRRDLDWLISQGCRKIGLHVPDDLERAKTSVRTAVDWVDTRSDAVETLTFVDLKDDYFNCFGLDSFGRDRGVSNPAPTHFESYYEHEFLHDISTAFGHIDVGEGYPCCVVTGGDVSGVIGGGIFLPMDFSVGLFYTVLVPQAVARVTGNLQDMFDFAVVSGMPLMDRLMLGFASPYTILSDTGLLPKDSDIEYWMHLAQDEFSYFSRVLTHHIIGGVREAETDPAARLARQGSPVVKGIVREISGYLSSFETCLNEGVTLPNNYLQESVLESRRSFIHLRGRE